MTAFDCKEFLLNELDEYEVEETIYQLENFYGKQVTEVSKEELIEYLRETFSFDNEQLNNDSIDFSYFESESENDY